ncbi:MAG: alkaline phytoceramidase, partial [Pseudomonadota bacterium]
MDWRTALLAATGAVFVIIALLADPIAQDPAYHAFADQRTMLGIPNFLNVISNGAFVAIGLTGIAMISRTDPSVLGDLKLVWLMLFLGLIATAAGSSYYHWNPSNATLAWDRLGMVIGFMSLVALVVGEYGSKPAARALLWPLLVVGIASVLYWIHTESLGRGDMRPYAFVQFVPILLIPLTLLLYGVRSDLTRWFWLLIACYLLAKVAEHFDTQLLALGHLLSGHSIKHLLAALAPACL